MPSLEDRAGFVLKSQHASGFIVTHEDNPQLQIDDIARNIRGAINKNSLRITAANTPDLHINHPSFKG